MQKNIDKYQNLVKQTIPITQYMQWSILELDHCSITSQTLLAPNINVHGTGFAGSVYSAAVATGWTLLKFWQDNNQFESILVAAEANIKYLSPANSDLICRAKLDPNIPQYLKLITRLRQKQSCSLPLEVEVVCKDKVCAILKVQFVFKC